MTVIHHVEIKDFEGKIDSVFSPFQGEQSYLDTGETNKANCGLKENQETGKYQLMHQTSERR